MSDHSYTLEVETPISSLILKANQNHLLSCQFKSLLIPHQKQKKNISITTTTSPILNMASSWIKAYFQGSLKPHSLPLNIQGSLFKKKIYSVLQTIPYGDTLSYQELATLSQSPKAYRAVGSACKKNPFVLFIPCHRVLGKSKPLLYTPGPFHKQFLLNLEMTHKK